MSNVDRWLLPDGIGDVLPPEAGRIEILRRRLLDLFASWGYDYVIPPLLEFTESLLTSHNRDLDVQTFKVTDQISGRTMGLRADITPQAARIDAHSLNRQGSARLCYAASVLHTRPANALATRSPIQIGAECFGIASIDADIEVIALMCELLAAAGLSGWTVSLGHVGVFNAIIEQAGMSSSQQNTVLDILQRKALPELPAFVAEHQLAARHTRDLTALMQWHGSVEVLQQARQHFGQQPKVLRALDELSAVFARLQARYPQATWQVDLAELPGYHYHTGIVFAAYGAGAGAALANGGRYDNMSKMFGRHRSATGFNADLKTLMRIGKFEAPAVGTILVRGPASGAVWTKMIQLRQQGTRVIEVGSGEVLVPEEVGATHELIEEQGHCVIKSLA